MLIYQRSIQKKWYNILNIIKYVGQSVCQALPFFYAFSDCDTVSSFHGIGKCTWWDALMNYASKDDLTGIFSKLSMTPNCIMDQDMIAILDLMKSVYFSPDDVNENLSSLRLKYFLHRCDDNFKKIAPSYSALCMHVKRACYQAGYLWAECLCDVSLLNPCEWGWMRDNEGSGVIQIFDLPVLWINSVLSIILQSASYRNDAAIYRYYGLIYRCVPAE